jgi:2'-phosphotransferase
MASNFKRSAVGMDVQFSKAMTYLLRHGAEKEGLNISQDGYIALDDILKHKNLRKAKKEDLIKIVENCPKQRFSIKHSDDNVLYIRANQGHSIQNLELQMTEITEMDNLEEALHGTYYKAWELIKTEGLRKMTRQHIHFSEDFPGSKEVISGMRGNCQIAVYIDIKECLNDGIKFYRSENNVILSPGDQMGFIRPKYFKRVYDLKTNELLELHYGS